MSISTSYHGRTLNGQIPRTVDVTNPNANDSSAHGYIIGSTWTNTATGVVYTLVDDTPGAAVWKAGLSSGAVVVDSLTGDLSTFPITGAAGVGSGTAGSVALTGGASAGASGTAGPATLDAGPAAGGTGAPVEIADVNATATYLNRGPLKSLIVGSTLTALGTTQNSTPTLAQLIGGILTQTGTTGAGTVTLPSGTTVSSAMPRTPVVGDSFELFFASLTGQALTITGTTGTTVIGTAAVPSGKNAFMRFINTGANTWNIYVIVSA